MVHSDAKSVSIPGPDMSALIARLEKGEITSNEFDVLVEVASFEPDEIYKAASANWAGTKVIYTMADGSKQTCWALDWHLQKDILKAKAQGEGGHG